MTPRITCSGIADYLAGRLPYLVSTNYGQSTRGGRILDQDTALWSNEDLSLLVIDVASPSNFVVACHACLACRSGNSDHERVTSFLKSESPLRRTPLSSRTSGLTTLQTFSTDPSWHIVT